jgi:spore coat protein U-like protein
MKKLSGITDDRAGIQLANPQFSVSSLYMMAMICFGILLLSINLFASTSSVNVNISATVPTNCKFNSSGNNLFFGTYDPTSPTPLDVSGSAIVRCTKNTSVTLSLNNGLYASGSQRRMFDGSTQFINYQIYTTTARTTIWNTTNTVTLVAPSSANQTVTLYGRIPAGQNSGTSGYTDTVTITATF